MYSRWLNTLKNSIYNIYNFQFSELRYMYSIKLTDYVPDDFPRSGNENATIIWTSILNLTFLQKKSYSSNTVRFLYCNDDLISRTTLWGIEWYQRWPSSNREIQLLMVSEPISYPKRYILGILRNFFILNVKQRLYYTKFMCYILRIYSFTVSYY